MSIKCMDKNYLTISQYNQISHTAIININLQKTYMYWQSELTHI